MAKKKKCTLAVGRNVYVRKACQGMELKSIQAQMQTLAADALVCKNRRLQKPHACLPLAEHGNVGRA